MKTSRGQCGPAQRAGVALAALGALVFAGCQVTHDVVVDAISDPARPLGTSYRLVAHDPGGGVDKELGARAVAAVQEALAARGLYAVPAGVRPDMVIELTYGVGSGEIKLEQIPAPIILQGKGDRARYFVNPVVVFEKYISLSAHAPLPPDGKPATGPGRGDEWWNLRVSIEDKKQELGPYLPVLASVGVDYVGENSGREKHIIVKGDHAVTRRPGAHPIPPS